MGQPALDTSQALKTGRSSASIDWAVAVVTAQRLLPAGPALPPEQAAATVRQLRELSVIAETHVRELTGLDDGHPPPTAVNGTCRLVSAHAVVQYHGPSSPSA